MGIKYGRGPKSQVNMRMSVGGFVEPGPSTQAVVPYKLNSFDLDDWHLVDGWPVPGAGAARDTSVFDITPDPKVFPTPTTISTNADVRWTADNFSGSWPAFSGSGTWSGSGTKKTHKYRTGGVSYSVSGVKLDSDDEDSLQANLSSIAGNRYSLVLVFKPYGANTDNADSEDDVTYGLVAPATAATGQPELRVRNDKLMIKQSSELAPKQPWTGHRVRSFQHFINRGAPSYLVWSVGANHFHLYIGDGPSTMEHHGLGDVHDLPKSYNLRLGAYANGTHTADMMLFDVGFYKEILTGPQAVNEVALLAAAYGGK
jgi:hypothetical protein